MELQGEIDKFTILISGFNIPVLIADRVSRPLPQISQGVEALTNHWQPA